jgi:hypothetical protein
VGDEEVEEETAAEALREDEAEDCGCAAMHVSFSHE